MPPKRFTAAVDRRHPPALRRGRRWRSRALVPPARSTSSAAVWMVPGSFGLRLRGLADDRRCWRRPAAARIAIAWPMPRVAPVMKMSCAVDAVGVIHYTRLSGRATGTLRSPLPDDLRECPLPCNATDRSTSSANIITTGMCGTISAASCSGPDGRCGASPVTSRHGLRAQLESAAGSNGLGSILPDALPFDRATLFSARDPPGRRARLGEHLRQHGRIERSLIERDLADARHRGHDARLDLDGARPCTRRGPSRSGVLAARSRGTPARSRPRPETRRGASGSASSPNAPPDRRSAADDARRRTCRSRRRPTCSAASSTGPCSICSSR